MMSKEIRFMVLGVVIGGLFVFTMSQMKTEPDPVPEILPPKEKANNGLITGYELPHEMEFAGEYVPLFRNDVREKLEREIQVNAFWHSNSVILIKRTNRWLPTIDSILIANDVPTDFKYLAVAESGLSNVVSPSKAEGFWQFLKGTARDFGLIVNREIDQRYDPVLATVAATRYLKKAHEKFGSWTMVAASYNLGMNATAQIIEKQRPETYYDMHMSEEPSRYVFRILALKNMLQNQEQFGFTVDEEDRYELESFERISITHTIADLHDFASEQNTTYYHLRRLNPWIRDYRLTLKPGQKLEIKIPVN